MNKFGRNACIGVGVGATAGVALLIFLIIKGKRRGSYILPQPGCSPRHVLSDTMARGSGVVATAAPRLQVSDSVLGVTELVLPDQQGELRHYLDEVLKCVSDLRGEVAELKSSLQDIAVQIVQDVKVGLEESQRATRRQRRFLPRERTESQSSSSIYFTASGVSQCEGESEGGYTTANPESDYYGDTDQETDREAERDSEDEEEEEQSCATVCTLQQDSREDEEDDEASLALDAELPSDELAHLLFQSDALHLGGVQERIEGFHLLQAAKPQHGEHKEFLWRLARAYTDMYEATDDAEERKAFAEQGRDEAEDALRRDGLTAEGHKCFAVLAGLTSHYETMHGKLKSSHILKEHVDRAVTLKADDPHCFYLLGHWCYEVASLGWLEKKAAAALYQTPPTATLQDALENFLKGEELSPGFSRAARLYVAKCHKDLGNVSEAKKWFELASQIHGISYADTDCAGLEEALQELRN